MWLHKQPVDRIAKTNVVYRMHILFFNNYLKKMKIIVYIIQSEVKLEDYIPKQIAANRWALWYCFALNKTI